jgi:ubiquinone/menaquinone biosynthesis C-methylase UbiE
MKPVDAVTAFDRLASRYDVWYQTPLGAFADALEKEVVFTLADVRSGEWALDVGCGTGNYTLALARLGARVVGVDPATAMLAIATSKTQEAELPVRFARATAEHLPFPEGSFDLVVSVTTLEFVASPEGAVAEMVRVVRPNGRLVVEAAGLTYEVGSMSTAERCRVDRGRKAWPIHVLLHRARHGPQR